MALVFLVHCIIIKYDVTKEISKFRNNNKSNWIVGPVKLIDLTQGDV
jgi:hypothetical protein